MSIIIQFVQHDGTENKVYAEVGQTAMQAAINNQVPGILGDCGGSCSCATCHVYIDETWQARVPPAEAHELDMLTCALDVSPRSRLSCQINLATEMDGIVIHLPKSQI